MKLKLVDSCLALLLDSDSNEWKTWKGLFNRAGKLNKKRNKIVHEPVGVMVKGRQRIIAISPSHFNSLALAKKQTTHKGRVVTPTYKSSGVSVLEEHTLGFPKLYSLERSFKGFAQEIRAFKESLSNGH